MCVVCACIWVHVECLKKPGEAESPKAGVTGGWELDSGPLQERSLSLRVLFLQSALFTPGARASLSRTFDYQEDCWVGNPELPPQQSRFLTPFFLVSHQYPQIEQQLSFVLFVLVWFAVFLVLLFILSLGLPTHSRLAWNTIPAFLLPLPSECWNYWDLGCVPHTPLSSLGRKASSFLILHSIRTLLSSLFIP